MSSPRGSLHAGVSSHWKSTASAFIEPILPEFFELYPNITLDLRIERELVDVIGEGIDAGIRLGEKLDRDMICVSLSGAIRSIVVATPSYFDRHERPAHPRDLAAHNCIRVKSVTGRQPVPWDFCDNGQWFDVEVGGSLITNDSAAALRAALSGIGMRHALLLDVEEHLAAGRLESVLECWLPPTRASSSTIRAVHKFPRSYACSSTAF